MIYFRCRRLLAERNCILADNRAAAANARRMFRVDRSNRENAVKHADHAIDAPRLQGHHGQHRQGHTMQASLITVGPASLQALSPPPPQKEDGQDPTIKRTSPDSHGRPPSLGITAGSRTSGRIRRQNDCDDTQRQASPSNSTHQGGCRPGGLGEWHLRQRPQSRQELDRVQQQPHHPTQPTVRILTNDGATYTHRLNAGGRPSSCY